MENKKIGLIAVGAVAVIGIIAVVKLSNEKKTKDLINEA